MIAIVIGTRPELIKIFPVINELKKQKIKYKIIHTGQHYSKNLHDIFIKKFRNLKINYNLKVGSYPHSKQTGLMMIKLEKIFIKEKITKVIVYGDTNSALAGALVASKIKQTKLIHIEAGLRSREANMPEETNRVIIDHISDYLFAPTTISKKFLLEENIPQSKIFLSGNTIKDSLGYLNNLIKKADYYKKLKLNKNDYFLVTLHREENTDNFICLKKILNSLADVSKKFKKIIVFPCHPRTKKMISIKKISVNNNIKIIDPLSYDKFLNLLYFSFIVISDSGGIQEECCLLKKRLLTIRTKTERQETIKIGCNILSNVNSAELINKIIKIKKRKIIWSNPYGKKNVSKVIVNKIKKFKC